MARAHPGARVVAPLRDPGARRPRVLAREAAQQRSPIEPALRLARRDPLGRLGKDAARKGELLPQRVGRPGPPVVEHPRTGCPRPQAPLLRAHAEPLRVLVGADVLAQAHAPHLAPVPVPVGRERVEVAVEMEIVDQQAFHPRVPVPLADPLLEDLRAPLVEDLVGLDVESPGAAAGGHRAVGLDGERRAAAGEVPHRVEDAHSRVAERGDQLARAVVRAPHVHDHLVAHVEQRPDGGDDRVIERDGVADDGETGEHVRPGTACRGAAGRRRRPRTRRRASRAPRCAPRTAR